MLCRAAEKNSPQGDTLGGHLCADNVLASEAGFLTKSLAAPDRGL